ncbi:MAG: alpha/beta fold hydrolase [Ancrocorticia sp.]
MILKKTMAATIAVGALLLAGCSSTPDDASGESASPAPSSSSEASASASATEKTAYAGTDISIDAGTHQIPATVVLPDSASADNPVPAVVMLHGTGSQRHEAGDGYIYMADALAKAGIASIRIDFMGSGDSTAPDEDFDLDNALGDAEAAIGYISEQPEINAEQVGVMGWSQGGLHALRVAADDERVRAAVTWAAPAAPMEVTEDQRAEAAEKGYFTEEFDWRAPMDTGQKWIDGMDALDMKDVASQITVPLLLINGGNDDVVPPSNAEELHGWIPSSEVLIIDGADHTFNIFSGDMAAFNELMTATAGFFADNLK